MARLHFTLWNDVHRINAVRAIQTAPPGSRIEVKGPARSLPQNDFMWAILTALSEQLPYHGVKRSTEDWKDILSAAVRRTHGGGELVPGLNGGIVQLGSRTSDMTVDEMADLITLALSVCDQNGVQLPQEHQSAA